MHKLNNTKKKSFGLHIRTLRLNSNIGQRKLAEKVGIAPSYLNDIEKEKRSSPNLNIIKKLAIELNANIDELNDLAGISKKTLAPDILEYVDKNPSIITLIRSIKDRNFSDEEIKKIANSVTKSSTKALIIAAGLGSRLKNHTENLPKCMLDFGGKTLLQRQLDAY